MTLHQGIPGMRSSPPEEFGLSGPAPQSSADEHLAVLFAQLHCAPVGSE